MGIKRRCEALGLPLPEMIVVDNCCQVEKEIHKALPDIQVCLDIYHFMMRYLAVILNGMNNPHRNEVAAAIRNAVLKNSASKGVLTQYWNKDEQKANMISIYERYSRRGGVWSAAAHAVHTAQLKHLDRGCLSRRNQDVASDGSRIEGSHKGWNSIQRASASGLELQNALCHDFVLRRNVRIAFGKKSGAKTSNLDPFVRSTFGSHHTRLVNHAASILNSILHTEAGKRPSGLLAQPLSPMLKDVPSGEIFGLVVSQYNSTSGGLIPIKSENPDDQLLNLILDTSMDPQDVLADLNIDPMLLLQPAAAISGSLISDPDPRILQHTPSVPVNKRKEPDTSALLENLSSPEINLDSVSIPPAKKQRASTDVQLSQEPRSLTTTDKAKGTHPFFSLSSAPTPTPPATKSTAFTANDVQISGLSKLLPLPTPSDSVMTRPTRSEKLFATLTGTDPNALSIGQGKEFYLFVDMREELRWKSSDMTSKKWAEATLLYNERLGISGAAKRPRALSDKLAELERSILNRIIKNDFKSRNGDEKFWRKHCFSVSLIKVDTGSTNTSARAVATCHRCGKIMYPGPNKSPENHKKGYCTDGFKQKSIGEEFAPWPQPTGLFTTGTEFHPIPFLTAIRDVYEKAVMEADSNISLEQEAFLSMLKNEGRVVTSTSGAVLFKLFSGYNIPPDDLTPSTLFTELNGCKYLRIDALRDTDLSEPSSSGSQPL
ncbi:hypothetical protein B0H15DRAFT_914092 [Mycena belliarum]|uniref:Transposase n=1 Tax=Mycena belliarum TaxID=1033014 RepID=A0AAD6XLF5_9AGAR|nr:hypothetical protein B0H15DRAFT_914092 [Mycena belliae]